MNENPTFILAGNGPYENRGCEAIVRGTVRILREFYDDPSFLCVSFFQNKEQFEKQCHEEYDSAIIHKEVNHRQSKYDSNWLLRIPFRKVYPSIYKNWMYTEIIPYIKKTKAVLAVGGDNYSLDYGIPTSFTYLDDIVLERKKPMIIWGASVGPFSKNPEYENYMIEHLKKITGIFARESATTQYLEKNTINNNVHSVSDPAFLLESTKPKLDFKLMKNSIGINLSPLMAKYIREENNKMWEKIASEILLKITENTDEHIYLIPHVTSPQSNDYIFMKNVLSNIKYCEDKITLVPPNYNAAEMKWIISKMNIFAGARTHSTIAALSSCVPTLSFAYSIKAQGINNDIFGHSNYCLVPNKIDPKNVTEKILLMKEQANEIKETLKEAIPDIEKKAMLAGSILKQIT